MRIVSCTTARGQFPRSGLAFWRARLDRRGRSAQREPRLSLSGAASQMSKARMPRCGAGSRTNPPVFSGRTTGKSRKPPPVVPRSTADRNGARQVRGACARTNVQQTTLLQPRSAPAGLGILLILRLERRRGARTRASDLRMHWRGPGPNSRATRRGCGVWRARPRLNCSAGATPTATSSWNGSAASPARRTRSAVCSGARAATSRNCWC